MLALLEAIEDEDLEYRRIPCAGLVLSIAKEIGFVEEYEDAGLVITKRGQTFMRRARR